MRMLYKIFTAGALTLSLVGGMIASAPSAEAASVCVIPGRSANGQQIKIPARQADFSEIKAKNGEPKQIKTFVIAERLITGILPEIEQEKEIPECPISETEFVMMAKVLKRECGGLVGVYGGVSAKARQAAVVWCALNRLDSDDPYYPDTLAGVLTQSGAFAWIPDTYVDTELLDLAKDVVFRWWKEKNGESDVGRTLPKEFLFFAGRNGENHFRDNYASPFTYWDWSLADPYAEE